jgi:serine protease Do
MRVIPFTFAALLVVGPARAEEPTKEDLLKFEKHLKAAHANVGPAMACIVVSRSDKYPKPARTPEPGALGAFDRDAFLKTDPSQSKLADRLDLSKTETIPDHGFAGGMVIDAAGYVLTNYSTIDGASKIYVHLPGGKGSYADIRAADSRSDLAVLQLLSPPPDLKTVRFGPARLPDVANDPKATVFPGKLTLIMAYANASGTVLDQASAGLAPITMIRHPESRDANTLFRSVYYYSPIVEYESRANPGISGGAVLNLDGEVIALTAGTAAIPNNEVGRSYALPVDDNLLRIIEVLRRGEEVEYGFLGVIRPDFTQPGQGLPVVGLPSRGSPAAHADLRPNDRITRINDHPVVTFEDLLLYVGSGLAGGKLKLQIERPGQPSRTATVTLAKFKNEMPYIATVKPEPVFGLRVDYTSMISQMLVFNPFGGRNLNEIPSGVHVREVIPDSPAAVKFKSLAENNRLIITQVNGQVVHSPPEFYKACKGQKSVRLTVSDPTDFNVRREITLP